jgi:hypothetical protein
MIRRFLLASMACLSLSACITYTGDGYYSSPGGSYNDYGDDDGYYGSPGYYGDYSYGYSQASYISFSFGFGSPYYGYYPSYYGYGHCSPWSAYCYGGRYPYYGYGWSGYWPAYGNNHHHHHHDKPKKPRHPRDDRDRPNRPDRGPDYANGADRPGHNTDFPIGVQPDGQRPRPEKRPAKPIPQPIGGSVQPIAGSQSPVKASDRQPRNPRTQPIPDGSSPEWAQRPRTLPDGEPREFRRSDRIPAQTPIRTPQGQPPVPVSPGDGQYTRLPKQVRVVRGPQQPINRPVQPERVTEGYAQQDRPVRSPSAQGMPQGPRQAPQPKRERAESAPKPSQPQSTRRDEEP